MTRKVFSSGRLVAVDGTVDTVVVPTSRTRRSITFSIAGGGPLAMCLGNSKMAIFGDPNTMVLLINTGTSFVTLTYETHGECVRQAWHAWGTAGGMSLCVLEAYDSEQVDGPDGG